MYHGKGPPLVGSCSLSAIRSYTTYVRHFLKLTYYLDMSHNILYLARRSSRRVRN